MRCGRPSRAARSSSAAGRCAPRERRSASPRSHSRSWTCRCPRRCCGGCCRRPRTSASPPSAPWTPPGRSALARAQELAGLYIAPVVPQIAGALTFLAGALLLFSGATPAIDERLAFLHQFLPLAVLEVSHLGASLVGLGLLVLSRALFRR